MQQRRRGGMQEASFFSNIFFALFPHILLHEFTSRMVSNKMSVTARITDAATNGNMAHDTRWISLKNQIYFCTSAPRKTLGVTGDCRRYRRACQLASSPTRPCLLPRLCSCLIATFGSQIGHDIRLSSSAGDPGSLKHVEQTARSPCAGAAALLGSNLLFLRNDESPRL